ncbi:MAG TPA: HAMP domain-containing sensor histidine kinase [Gemmatimonadota bacterium]|nr:HAMP domain-containing sensor histidine kinase [Gemmatimonadota bacterium]
MRRNQIRTKLIVTFILLVTGIIAVSAMVWYRVATDHVRREMENRLLAAAEAGGLLMDPWFTNLLVTAAGDNTRRVVQEELAIHKERLDVRDAYIFDRERRILATTDTLDMQIGVPAAFLDNYAEEIDRLFETGESVVTVPFRDETGNVYQTAIVPLEGCRDIDDETGQCVGGSEIAAAFAADLSVEFLEVFDDFRRLTVVLILVGVGLTVVVGFFFARSLSRPIGRLVSSAERMERGEMHEPVALDSGDEIGYLGTALENMRKGIVRRDRHLRTMLAGVAHEIRNPLGGIEIFAGLLRDDLDEHDGRRGHLDKIIREVQHLKTIVNEFLIYARPRQPVIEPFSLRETLDDVLFLLAGEAESRGLAVEVELVEPEVAVYADVEQVKRALMNLIKNAIQASPRQGRVEVRAQRVQEKVRISIKDYGAGIAPDHVRQIFDPFFTTKGSGAGLGLSIVRSIVEENDGEIWVESVPGEKTIFFVVLPAVESETGRFRAERAGAAAG